MALLGAQSTPAPVAGKGPSLIQQLAQTAPCHSRYSDFTFPQVDSLTGSTQGWGSTA
jgi:hypothetical protein